MITPDVFLLGAISPASWLLAGVAAACLLVGLRGPRPSGAACCLRLLLQLPLLPPRKQSLRPSRPVVQQQIVLVSPDGAQKQNVLLSCLTQLLLKIKVLLLCLTTVLLLFIKVLMLCLTAMLLLFMKVLIFCLTVMLLLLLKALLFCLTVQLLFLKVLLLCLTVLLLCLTVLLLFMKVLLLFMKVLLLCQTVLLLFMKVLLQRLHKMCRRRLDRRCRRRLYRRCWKSCRNTHGHPSRRRRLKSCRRSRNRRLRLESCRRRRGRRLHSCRMTHCNGGGLRCRQRIRHPGFSDPPRSC